MTTDGTEISFDVNTECFFNLTPERARKKMQRLLSNWAAVEVVDRFGSLLKSLLHCISKC